MLLFSKRKMCLSLKIALMLFLSMQLAFSINPLIMVDDNGSYHLQESVRPECCSMANNLVKARNFVIQEIEVEKWTEQVNKSTNDLVAGGFEVSATIMGTLETGHENSILAMIFRDDAAHQTLVHFRGATPLVQFGVDWEVLLNCRDHIEGDNRLVVHRGIFNIARSVQEKVITSLRSILIASDALFDERVVFSGHSMGGAVSLQVLLSIAPTLGTEFFGGEWREENHFNHIGLSAVPFVASNFLEAANNIVGVENMLNASVYGDGYLSLAYYCSWGAKVGTVVDFTHEEVLSYTVARKVKAHQALAGFGGKNLTADLVNVGLNHEKIVRGVGCSIM